MWNLIRRENGQINWLSAYLMGGFAYLIKVTNDIYQNTLQICEIYPGFPFWDTFKEEWRLHHTTIPFWKIPITTILVFLLYLVLLVAWYLHILEIVWLFFTEYLGGRWIHEQLFVQLPS